MSPRCTRRTSPHCRRASRSWSAVRPRWWHPMTRRWSCSRRRWRSQGSSGGSSTWPGCGWPTANASDVDGRWRRLGCSSTPRSTIFERLGARPWVDRTSAELRATGQTKPRAGDNVLDRLTPQEFEIVTLAASGLTNKQIAERLFLSHRTVGGHLHRAFPKLGVATRAALRDALESRPAQRARRPRQLRILSRPDRWSSHPAPPIRVI